MMNELIREVNCSLFSNVCMRTITSHLSCLNYFSSPKRFYDFSCQANHCSHSQIMPFPKHIDQEVVEGGHMVVLFLILLRTIVPISIMAGVVYLLNNVQESLLSDIITIMNYFFLDDGHYKRSEEDSQCSFSMDFPITEPRKMVQQ